MRDSLRRTRNAHWTIRRRLDLAALVYVGSVLANLLIATLGVVWYLRPVFVETTALAMAQERLQQARSRVRSLHSSIERPNPQDSANISAELGAIMADLGRDLPKGVGMALSATTPAGEQGSGSLLRADAALADLGAELEQLRTESVQRATHAQHGLLLVVAGSSLAGLGLCLLGIWKVRRWMVQPVLELRRATKSVASGDYAPHLDLPYDDEIAALGREIQSMAREIGRMEIALLDRERRDAAQEIVTLVRSTLLSRLGELRAQAELAADDGRTGNEVESCRDRILGTVDKFQAWLESLQLSVTPDAPSHTSVCPLRLLEDVAGVLRPAAEARGVKLHVEVDPDLPEALLDAGQLAQALVALGTNAVEASERDRSVRLIAARAGDSSWYVCVEDSGAGIPADVLNHLFTPFFTTKPHGNGVGLGMVKAIVESHGGSVAVDSQPGHGSRFVLTLPFGVAEPRR